MERKLTQTEIQIYRLVSAGYTTKQIAEILSKSPRTIFNQRSIITQKLKKNNTLKIGNF